MKRRITNLVYIILMKRHYLFLLMSLLLPTLSWGQQLFSGGDGSEAAPYQIANEADLRKISELITDKAYNGFEGKHFRQTANITLTQPFIPIGGNGDLITPNWEQESIFKGVYDGDMKKIYNLNIFDENQLLDMDPNSNLVRSRVGLFGLIGGKAVVKNVVVASGIIYGGSSVGTIVGWMRPEATVSHCKVANKVQVFSRYSVGGIVGSAEKQTLIEKCVNYGSIRCYGEASIQGVAGGIAASISDTRVEGCANFGDVYSVTSFVGGIVGLYPLTQSGISTIEYTYPVMQSCMNAGDAASRVGVAGGLVGTWPYAPKEKVEEGVTPPTRTALKNCYSYGQTFVSTKKSFGPVIGFVQAQYPQTSEKTFYNADRFFYKVDPQFSDSEIAFIHGEAKTHQHMRSAAFLNEINEGSLHQFAEDKYNMNYGMPVLKWIIDSYDAEIDVPIYADKNLQPSVYKEHAGTFFRPNRAGDFIMVNMDMQSPNIQMKSLGHTINRAWAYRTFPIGEGQTYRFFNSTSRFRRPFSADGGVNLEAVPNAANHWLITPEFEVTQEKPFFVWKAASEYGPMKEGYKVYIAGEEATSPEQFKDAKLLFETAGEEAVIEVPKSPYDDEHYKLHHRAVDLSGYVGKKVRIAFVDDTKFQFTLILGMFNVAETAKETGIEMLLPAKSYTVHTEGETIRVETSGENLTFELYDLTGKRIAVAKNHLIYTTGKGAYVLKVQDQLSRTEVRKIIL